MTRQAGGLGLALALVLLPSNVPAAALPLLRSEWSASGTDAGWIVSAYLIGYAVAVLLVLPLTDRVGAANVIVAATLTGAIASIAFPLLAHDVAGAVVLRLVAGAALAGIYMPGVRLAAQMASARRRGLAVGLYVASFYLGSSLSFLFAGALLNDLGWRGAAAALAAASVLAVPFAVAGIRGAPAGGVRGGARLDVRVIGDARLVRAIAAYTGHGWELFVLRGWLAAFLAAVLVSRGSDAIGASAEASAWSSVILGLSVPAVFVGGAVSDLLGRPRAALAFAVTSGVISLGFGALFGAPWAVIVAVGCVHAALVAADSAVYSVMVTELAPAARIGSAQAVQAVAGFGIGAIGPVAAGAMLDLGLGWTAVFAVGGAGGIVAALPLLRDATRRWTG